MVNEEREPYMLTTKAGYMRIMQAGKTADIIAALIRAAREFENHQIDPFPTIVLTDPLQVLQLTDAVRAMLIEPKPSIDAMIDVGYVTLVGKMRVQWNAADIRSRLGVRA